MSLLSLALTAAAGLLSIPVAVLLIEVVAARKATVDRVLKSVAQDARARVAPARVAVIVPAHNESIGIIPTLEDIRSQLGAGDRLVVVADNCSDDTALVAASAGAEVIERNDPSQLGKGYALGWAVNHLSTNAPDFVVIIDADCRIQSDLVRKLTAACWDAQRPVQACFLMKASVNSPIDHGFAEFAFLLRNWVRPLGLHNLGLSAQMMGSGMIFPWDVIRTIPLANGHLVEDLKLGLDLAAIGQAPLFLPSAKVTSYFPVTAKGTESQRQRWVQGHMGIILKSVPRLIWHAVRRRNANLLALTLDVLIPPLSLLLFMTAAMFLLAALAAMFGLPATAFWIASGNLAAFFATLSFAWAMFGRDIVSARKILSIGPLVLKRFRLFRQLALGRTATQWVRTDRGRPD